MTNVVAICNLALSHLGDEAEVSAISPPDGTVQAAHCARFYPIARDALLEAHPWYFAVKRVPLAEVEDNPVADDWTYAYAIPSTCIRPLSLLYPGVPEKFLSTESDAGSHPFLLESAEDGSKILFTNVEGAYLRFIDTVTDPTKFTPLFVTTLGRLLASYLAGPVLKGQEGRREAAAQLKLFELEYLKATASSANVGRRSTYETRKPDWIAGRGFSGLNDGRITYE